MRRGVEYAMYRIEVPVIAHIPHLLIAHLTLNYLLEIIMAGRHGGRRENAGRKSNQEIGNAANPTENSMDSKSVDFWLVARG